MNMNQRAALGLAVVGSLAAVVAIWLSLTGDIPFGFPGTPAYARYEAFNRRMAPLLLLQSCAPAAFAVRYRSQLGKWAKRLTSIALASWPAAALGVAAEFWLFSDQPYQQANLRSVAFGVFSLSLFVGILSVMLLGIVLLRRAELDRLYAVSLILYLPLTLLVSLRDQALFITPALGALLLAAPAIAPRKTIR